MILKKIKKFMCAYLFIQGDSKERDQNEREKQAFKKNQKSHMNMGS